MNDAPGKRAPLDALFAPRSIALVGASNDAGKLGHLFACRLAESYHGSLFLVHHDEPRIAGHQALASMQAIPRPIDLLIAVVPAVRLVTLVESCPSGSARFLLAISAGFGEVSAAGSELEARLLAAARARNMRVVGPNCMGLFNGVLGLNASLIPQAPVGAAGLSCLTQSGGFAIAASMYALDHGLRLSKLCDLGNTTDIQVHDVLRFFRDDAETRIVGLYLEAVRQERLFLAEVQALAERKPVILTIVGRTSAGARASQAHLGLRADLGAWLQAELGPHTIAAGSGTELLNIARALDQQPAPRGKRVAIVTATGGIGAELADACLDQGLSVPPFSIALQARLRETLPSYAAAGNPVDLTPAYRDFPVLYPNVLQLIAASGEIDVLIVSLTDVATTSGDLVAAMTALDSLNKPVYVFWGGRESTTVNRQAIEAAGFPCYRTTSEAVRAVAGACYSVRDRAHSQYPSGS